VKSPTSPQAVDVADEEAEVEVLINVAVMGVTLPVDSGKVVVVKSTELTNVTVNGVTPVL